MLKEAIILAGGFGSRLKTVVSEMPKPMATVSGKPFLEYLLNGLSYLEFSNVILSVGYRYEVIERHFGNSFKGLKLTYAIENEPLGTGGGILNALSFAKYDELLVLNGDTFFDIDIKDFYAFHSQNRAELSVALRRLNDGSRYGSIEIDTEGRIIHFKEKQVGSVNVLINGGTYILMKKTMMGTPFQFNRFSFEKDYLENFYRSKRFFAREYSDYFIDIGIPETYSQAQIDFLKKP
jgi:D-glycero-alpha-D-manno-heptose 1-phosphate guanylyltransferase